MSNVNLSNHMGYFGVTTNVNFTPGLQTYRANSSVISPGFNRDNPKFTFIPKSPAYVLGEQVVRPMIDAAFRVVSYVIELLRTVLSSMDNALSKAFNFPPGAHARDLNQPFKESIFQSARSQADEKQVEGPFEPLKILHEGPFPTTNPLCGMSVVPLNQSLQWDAMVITFTKINEDFFSQARFINIQPDNELKFSTERTIYSLSGARRSEAKFPAGVEIDSERYVEVFPNIHNTHEPISLNIVNTKNEVIKTCGLAISLFHRDITLKKLNSEYIIVVQSGATTASTHIVNIMTCEIKKINENHVIGSYVFPGGTAFSLFTNDFDTKSISIKIIVNHNNLKKYNIKPSFYDNTHFYTSYVHVFNYDKTNVTLTGFLKRVPQQAPIFCSQRLSEVSFAFRNSHPAVCQEITDTIQHDGLIPPIEFSIQELSHSQQNGYIILFKHYADWQLDQGLITPMPTTSEFKLAPHSVSIATPSARLAPLRGNTCWIGANTGFIISNKKDPRKFSLLWPSLSGGRHRAYYSNPIFVNGIGKPGSIEHKNFFRTLISSNETISVFYTSSSSKEGIKYSFNYLRSSHVFPMTYVFNLQRGEIAVFGQHPSSHWFNASACNLDGFCASAVIEVALYAPPYNSTLLIITGIGLTALCTLSTSLACCLLGGILCKKYAGSSDYDNIELRPLLNDAKQKEYNNLGDNERLLKIESILEEGENHLIDLDGIENHLKSEKLKKIKEYALEALTLDRENEKAQALMDKFIKKEQEQELNTQGYKQGFYGDSFLNDYIIKLKSIDFTKNSNGSKLILGAGAQGTVYQAFLNTKKHGKIPVAVKKINTSSLFHKKGLEDIKKEAEVLLRLDHPNLVGMYGIINENDKYMLVMELMEESLDARLKKNDLSMKEKYLIIKDMTRGVDYLHKKGVFHRDLKTENILLKKGCAKITDFGKSRINIGDTTQMAGTPIFMDPGLLFGFYDEYKFYSDIYSLGMVILSIINGNNPFHNIESFNELRKVIIDEQKELEIADDCPEIIQKIIAACLNKQWDERPSAETILEWLKEDQA
jgi:tRNA A-37 threonylcarbamoyl transferase component Bud32